MVALVLQIFLVFLLITVFLLPQSERLVATILIVILTSLCLLYLKENIYGNFSVPSYEQQDINKALNDPYFHSLVRWTIFIYTGTRNLSVHRLDKIEEVKTLLQKALEDLE